MKVIEKLIGLRTEAPQRKAPMVPLQSWQLLELCELNHPLGEKSATGMRYFA